LKTIIIIPTYNEVANLPKLAGEIFSKNIPGLELLVVDDNSPDGTGQIAERLNERYARKVHCLHRPGKLGLGSAYIQGFEFALQHGAQVIGQMDADFSHPPEKLPPLIEALKGCDVALGSRYVKGGSLDERWPLWRKSLPYFGNLYARTILDLPLKDVTGGFRLWKRSTLERMPLDQIRSNGYIFQVEMAYVAYLLGFNFKEVPIHFADRRWGTSKMSFRIQMEAALRVWQLLRMYRQLQPS
jgi:dolichol-phosphate mannosyltransferase